MGLHKPASHHNTSTPHRLLKISFFLLVALTTVLTLIWAPSLASTTRNLKHLHLSTTRRRTTTFEPDERFFDLTDEGNEAWEAVLPPNGGFVVQKTEEGDYEMAGISMFHQLHCLQMIRTAIQDLKAQVAGTCDAGGHGNMVQSSEDDEDDVDDGVLKVSKERRHGPHPNQEHWVHCLDYLMQGILCAADDTIEMAHDTEDGRRVVDGYDVQHTCRDPDVLWKKIAGPKSLPGWSPSRQA